MINSAYPSVGSPQGRLCFDDRIFFVWSMINTVRKGSNQASPRKIVPLYGIRFHGVISIDALTPSIRVYLLKW
jgi:hypothetical protein